MSEPQPRRALTVVHRGAIEATDGVVARLRDAGLDAVPLDEPNFVVRLVALGTYRVRVAVPEDQAERAREALEAWDREASGNLAAWSQELGAQLRLALLPMALAGLAVWQFVPDPARLPWLVTVTPAVFLGSFILIAAWKRRH